MEDIILLDALNGSDYSDDDFEDALVLHVLHDDQNLRHRAALYGVFSLDDLFEIECKQMFRFHKNYIGRLCRALGIPEQIRTDTRECISGMSMREFLDLM